MPKNNKKKKKIEKILELINNNELDQALKLADINIIKDLFDIGVKYREDKVHDVAEKIFDRAIQLNPDFADAWNNKGVVLINLRKNNEAIKCFNQAIKINSDFEKAWNNKGVALNNLKKHDEAIKCYDKAIELNPNSAEAWTNKGIVLGNLKKYDSAIKCHDRAIELNPDFANAWDNKGVALWNLGKYDEAIKCFDHSIKINPNFASAWFNKAVALGNLGKYDEAIKCSDSAIKIKSDFSEALYNKCVTLGKLGRYDEAIKCYDKVIKIKPNLAEAWTNKGLAFETFGKNDEAIKCYNKAIEIKPNLVEAWYNKGRILLNLKKYDEAIKCHNRAIELNPNFANAWGNKGTVLLDSGKYDEAIKCYDQAIKLNPDDAKAWYNKGITFENLRLHNEAIKCYDQAIKLKPNFAEAYGNKGITFLNTRKYDEAEVELKKAREIFSLKGAKKDADMAYKFSKLAMNASELISNLEPLDNQFLNSLKSKTLEELKEKSMNISKEIQSVIKKFKDRNLPDDAERLLISKEICFTAISNALKFNVIELEKLRESEKIFEEWSFYTFAMAVGSLIIFIRGLGKYKNLEEIPKEVEEYLLNLLKATYVFDGSLTKEITKGEPFSAKIIETKIEKEPKIIYKHISDTETDWIKFCLVQLNFSIESKYHTKKFSLILKQKNKIKNKVFKAMEIAKANNINIICFPELSFDKEWINEIIKRYRDMIIIGGSYYDDGFNICPIIVNGVCFSPLYKKIEPSPYENPKSTGHGMKSGDKLFIFQTKYGRFSVLTCSDYTPKHISLICEYEAGSSKGVDFIINPRYEQNMLKHQDRCNVDSREYDICILQVNKAPEGEKFGKSCIIAKEHNILLQKYKDENIKPNDNINYKLCQAEGEMLMIVDLNIKEAPTIDITTNYPGRISTSKERWYKYENECWLPLST